MPETTCPLGTRYRIHIQDYWYEYTPLLLLCFLGLPEGRSWGEAAITLEAVDPQTDTVLATYTASERQPQDVTVYNEREWRLHYGQATGEALRSVLEQLKRAILADGPRLQARLAARRVNTTVLQPQEH